MTALNFYRSSYLSNPPDVRLQRVWVNTVPCRVFMRDILTDVNVLRHTGPEY